MAALAHVIVGLDRLTAAEMAVVSEVIALRTGTRPSSPTEVKPQKKGLFGPRKNKESLTPVLRSGNTLGVDPLKAEFIESDEAQRLLEAVSDLIQPVPSGPGRKRILLDRISSVRVAWDNIPERLQRPFRTIENRMEGCASVAATPATDHKSSTDQESPGTVPVELSSGSEDDLPSRFGVAPIRPIV